MENNQNGRQKIEDDQNGRQPKGTHQFDYNQTYHLDCNQPRMEEDDQNGRRPK